MIKGYATFCDADRHFYDAPHRLSAAGQGSRGALYEAALAPVPEGWQQHRRGDWLALRPVERELPPQGWKIHVSACLDNAETILSRVREYCLAHRVAFKFVPSRYLLHNRNAKYADRAASGKFITVYPADDDHCHRVARDLDALLAGEDGPYILSDLRWGEGPVYVRYGSFTQRHCYDEAGVLRPAVEDPDGRLVPDLRGPVFQTPSWVTVPDFLRPHLAARHAVTVSDLPYAVERALHFSNGGGVYVARDTRTGERVVLKEARPHAGLAADGADAVTRLRRERDALERLSGLACTPEVRDAFVLGDHHFLAMEYVEGKPLNTFFARRHPLIETDPSPEALADYTQWALRIHRLVEEAVEAVHARGVVFNDLHLFNIMVSEDESSVVLLDFEAAAHIDEGRRQTVANPAFVAPADRRGFDVDRYALACLRLALFLPLTSLLPLDPAKARHLADIAAAHFPVPRDFLDEAVAEILKGSPGNGAPDGPYLPVEPGDWPRSRDSLVRAITASATPDRDDRFFPGDIAQFATAGGGLTLGYGTAGVLYALAATGAPVHAEAEEWLLEHTKEPPSGSPAGLYDGLAGIAWTLDRLGHRARALELAELTLARPWEGIAPDLHSGLAGLGLALDALGMPDAALRCADLVSAALPGISRAGLLYGASGPALLFLRLYERTGDTALLDLAADALRRDLDRCVRSAGGTLQVDEGWRTMPYLGAGSVGIGMVLDDYAVHRADERFEQARGEIVRAAQSAFYAQPGLFRGAAGMVLHLSRTTVSGPGTREPDVRRQIDSLARHAVPYQGHLAFPGEQMMRLSMDLATGTAGCLLALGSAATGGRAHLPFLPPLRRPQSRSQSGTVKEHIVPMKERN
ncbi:class III lanthionine synthetase LanKC [Streptomyces sp. TRM76323]|uniref:non-specific serine/threonine protein kinase n=1 Tax=Streptomyces tamarix TaxID=3078565 RepID=A0ABU3QJE4_9ACTN|nr:class III lanthionine synthetase LanKC [Streptomyces tamarix]MDT9682862.1 class III lanthionine synthetase LanKC [Streptomyces tamarix]